MKDLGIPTVHRKLFSAALVVFSSFACWSCLGQVATTQLSLWCWQSTANGSQQISTNVPADATNLIAVAGGDGHIVALRADGKVLAWGLDNYGQADVPEDITNAVSIGAGSTHSLALLDDGTVRFWGSIYTTGVTNIPASAADNMLLLARGGCAQYVLSIRADSAGIGWGNTSHGLSLVPASATNLIDAAVGSFHAAALPANGKPVAWGQYYTGGSPTPPAAATNVVSLASGGFNDLALRADGSLVSWGGGTVPGGATNIVSIASGFAQAYALRADGQLFTWTTGSQNIPYTSPPASLTNVVVLSASTFGLMALTASNGLPLFGRPLNSPLLNGTTFRFRPIVLSTTPVSYQWMCAGTNLPGATNAMLVLSNAQASQSGVYALVASNAFGAMTNSGYNFTVEPLLVQTPPQSQTVAGGANASFTVALVGKGPFTYQWQFNGTNLPGATSSSLALASVQLDQAGPYNVIVSNSLGGVTSPSATLTVVPLFITGQPQPVTACIGGQPSISVTVTGTGPFTYQWQLNGTNLANQTSSSLALTNTLTLTNLQPNQAGWYSVVVSNAYGSVQSSNALLTLYPILITSQPQSQAAALSQTITFSVAAQAGQALNYQWQFNGTNLPGATGSTLILPHCQYNQSGTYQVFMDDGEYSSNSVPVSLSVAQIAAWGQISQGQVTVTATNLVAISCGAEHGLAMDNVGHVYGWGQNFVGQSTPPAGLTNAISIGAGNETSLALKNDGTVVQWGYLGTNVPSGLSNVVAIAAGDLHELALRSDGTVIAWGQDNYGETNVPSGLSNVVAIAAGEFTSMALQANGTVVTWGNNNYGQSQVPANLSNVVAIATGGLDDLALQSSGTLIGWGENGYGEDSLPPGVSNLVSIASGFGHTVALKPDGTVIAWGENAIGETNTPPGLRNVCAVSAKDYCSVALAGSSPPVVDVPILSCALAQGKFNIVVNSQSGRTYGLQYANALTNLSWNALPLVAGTGQPLVLSDTGVTNSAQRFYRVCRW